MIWAIADIMMFPNWLMLTAVSVANRFFAPFALRREETLLLQTFPEYVYYYERNRLNRSAGPKYVHDGA